MPLRNSSRQRGSANKKQIPALPEYRKAIVIELFLTFLKLGAFTIGGGIAMIPILHDSMVNDKKWFSDEEMVDIIAICQSMPGIIAVNMATYVGFKKRGLLGSLVATLGVILPSIVIILILAQGIDMLGDNQIVKGVFGGLRAAAAGLVILAVWQVGKTAVKDYTGLAIALISFAAIALLHINVAWIVLAFLVLGVIRAAAGGKMG
jgi:chromate transporter